MTFAIPAFFGPIGTWEMLIILAVVLLVFGGRRIPQLAKDLGSGIREFRRSLTGSEDPKIEDQTTDQEVAGKTRSGRTKG